jgi:hypothetical protein
MHQQHRISYKNSIINYYHFGNGLKILLCFHGYGTSGYQFHLLEKELGTEYTMIAIDFPFHGSTVWKENKEFLMDDLLSILKAVSVALKQHPKVNSSWLGDKIRINHHVNIGVAVAVEEGLLVPVVRFADTKSLSQIANEVKEFAQKAKDKKLQPSDWEGSTFTISNLGMFGIEEFTAIINMPDACILAIGGISQVPVVKNEQIVVGNVMKVTLSCDHRVVDGATGAAFLQTLKSLLEEPLRMMV